MYSAEFLAHSSHIISSSFLLSSHVISEFLSLLYSLYVLHNPQCFQIQNRSFKNTWWILHFLDAWVGRKTSYSACGMHSLAQWATWSCCSVLRDPWFQSSYHFHLRTHGLYLVYIISLGYMLSPHIIIHGSPLYQLSLLLRLLAFSLVKQVKMLQIPFLYAFNICQMINKFFLFSGKIFKNRIVIQNWGRQMASLNFNLIINDHLYQLLKSYTILKLFWCLSKNCNTMRA